MQDDVGSVVFQTYSGSSVQGTIDVTTNMTATISREDTSLLAKSYKSSTSAGADPATVTLDADVTISSLTLRADLSPLDLTGTSNVLLVTVQGSTTTTYAVYDVHVNDNQEYLVHNSTPSNNDGQTTTSLAGPVYILYNNNVYQGTITTQSTMQLTITDPNMYFLPSQDGGS
jgi:hypothetical protein